MMFSLEGEKERARILRAVKRLPVDLRTVVELRHLRNLSYREIAQRLDISIAAVSGRLYRARRLLQRKVDRKP